MHGPLPFTRRCSRLTLVSSLISNFTTMAWRHPFDANTSVSASAHHRRLLAGRAWKGCGPIAHFLVGSTAHWSTARSCTAWCVPAHRRDRWLRRAGGGRHGLLEAAICGGLRREVPALHGLGRLLHLALELGITPSESLYLHAKLTKLREHHGCHATFCTCPTGALLLLLLRRWPLLLQRRPLLLVRDLLDERRPPEWGSDWKR